MLTRNRRKKPSPPGSWKLQDAKARFSEVVRRARSEGPQRVTVHGKDTVVILSAEDYAKTRPPGLAHGKERTAADLIAVMQKGRRLGLKLRPAKGGLMAPRPPIDLSDGDEQ
jgi:prevent-host-death family protein